jgi:hypothetical protein
MVHHPTLLFGMHDRNKLLRLRFRLLYFRRYTAALAISTEHVAALSEGKSISPPFQKSRPVTSVGTPSRATVATYQVLLPARFTAPRS